MKISFISPNWSDVYTDLIRVSRKVATIPPINILTLATILNNAGHKIQFIDAHAENLSVKDIFLRVKSFSPTLVALTATTPIFHIIEKYAQYIKKRLDIKIIVGGPHTSYFKKKAFYDCFDYLGTGQWDNIIESIVKKIEEGTSLENSRGIVYRNNGNVHYHGSSQIITSFSGIPFPDRSFIKNDLYMLGTPRGKKRFTGIMTSRGCPFECIFCKSRMYGEKIIQRTVDDVMAEIENVSTCFGIKHILFLDDVLTINKRFANELAEELIRKKLDLTWEGSTRANLVDREMLKKMRDAGLVRLSFGLESVDIHVRKNIKKNIPFGAYEKANYMTKELGVETVNSVMLGLPGDTRESIKDTIRYVSQSRSIQHATFGIAIPYPGTEMYEMAQKGDLDLKLLTNDFSKYQRYEGAVMQVGDLSPKELIRLQRIGLLTIYSKWWRWKIVIKRFGFFSLILPFFKSLVMLFKYRR